MPRKGYRHPEWVIKKMIASRLKNLVRTGVTKNCLVCGKEFYEWNYQKGKRRFCSQTCSNVFNAEHLSKIRMRAGNPMFGKRPWNKGKFGAVKGVRGEKNHFWKGGITDESHRARTSGEWKKWRKAVFERDNYTCQICKLRGGKLVPHHVKLFRLFKEDRYVIANGVTLCKRCHTLLHNRSSNKIIVSL